MSGKQDKHIRKEVRKIKSQIVPVLAEEIFSSIYARSFWKRVRFAYYVIFKKMGKVA
jgi:hypothetical protein